MKAITKFWNFVKGKAKGLLGKIGVSEKDKEEKKSSSDNTRSQNKTNKLQSINIPFKDVADKESHHAYYKEDDLIIESTPMRIGDLFINKNNEAKQNNDDELLKNLNLAKSHYYKIVKPKEKALKDANLESSSDSEASKSRQKKAKGFDDNKTLKVELEKELNYFCQKYLKKLFNISNDEYPLPKLPVMSDNVKARSFVADYLNDQIPNGSEASKHTGNLEGWAELTGQRLKEPAKWVRMHLLPHQLGGNAVDSNLTPALGSINKKFSKGLELGAIDLAKKAPKQDRKVIWYKFNIEYYNGNVFPKFLFASYGTYSKAGKDWKRNNPIKEFSISPALPEMEFQAFDMKVNNWDTKEISKTLLITEGFAKVLKQNGAYSNLENIEIKLSSKINLSTKTNQENLAILERAERNNLITF